MSAAEFLPPKLGLRSLRAAAAGCRGCGLYEHATQTVFGEGHRGARLMLVGEQPGDKEDLAGRPFVGPAGGVLQRALESAGIDPADAYVTNAVKHFKFVVRGKRRIHVKPRVVELRACRPWLEAEVAVVKPSLIVALGASAAQSLLGRDFHLSDQRGNVIEVAPWGRVSATVHPASILREPDSAARHEAMDGFVADLKRMAKASRRS
jgi:uracil-DNA glycosylase family protein